MFGERLVIDGQQLDADVTGRLTSAKLIHTMEGASNVELTIDDHDLKLLRSGVLTRPGKPNKRAAKIEAFSQAAWERWGTARLTLDGAFFRLAGATGSYTTTTRTITLTFEDEIAALMRQQTKALKSSRGIMNRAEFAHWIARRSMHKVHFGFFSPQEGQRQQIAEPDTAGRKKGIHPDKHITVKGNAANDEQRRNIEKVLSVADDVKAGERATLALLVACIQESDVRNLPGGDRDSEGILQLRVSIHGRENARSVEKSARLFLTKGFWGKGGAIALASKNPDWSIGQIAQNTQGSGVPKGYDPWETEAKNILDARGGVSQTQILRERYEYRAGGRKDGKNRNYWDDSGTLADEVRWRRFAHANTLWFVSDEWLFARQPLYILSADSEGLLGFDFQVDVGVPVAEITLTARAARWTTPPAAVIELEDLGALTGRWLTWRSEEDLLDGSVELALHRPAPAKKEPAPGTRDVTTSEETPESGTVRARIVAEAKKTLTSKTGHNYYLAGGTTTTDPLAKAPLRSDCSQWTRAIYLKAGAPDPGIDTFTQAAKGIRTTDPQPGDLLFPPSRTHVELYIGNGKTIGHGTRPIDQASVSDFPGAFFVTYDFLRG